MVSNQTRQRIASDKVLGNYEPHSRTEQTQLSPMLTYNDEDQQFESDKFDKVCSLFYHWYKTAIS
jgi:hypothetical protein